VWLRTGAGGAAVPVGLAPALADLLVLVTGALDAGAPLALAPLEALRAVMPESACVPVLPACEVAPRALLCGRSCRTTWMVRLMT
jgi:hypothetical protein